MKNTRNEQGVQIANDSAPSVVLHRADTRGHADHGWLDSRQTFSFSSYYNSLRINFGVLRVLNDDRVEAGMGFGRHPHDNMEIISIPLEGALKHQDSLGNTAVISEGDIQVMSAGKGVFHSEYNQSKEHQVKFLQIWLFPNKKNVDPRYDQYRMDPAYPRNQLQQILSPDAADAGVWIHQDAWFFMGNFDEDFAFDYNLKKVGNGVYVFVIKGKIEIAETILSDRDGIGIWNTEAAKIVARSIDTQVLLMEIPMSIIK